LERQDKNGETHGRSIGDLRSFPVIDTLLIFEMLIRLPAIFKPDPLIMRLPARDQQAAWMYRRPG
jgi:hypothetical protein